jgi:hypothetical protein
MADVKVRFTADTTGVQQGAAKVVSSISKVKATASSVASAVKSIAAPLAALGGILGGLGVAGLASGLKDLMDYSGTISDLSARTGMAKGNLVIFGKALEDAGVSADSITKIIAGLSNKIEDPTADALEWLEKFGMDLKTLQSLSPEERFLRISKAIGGLSTQQAKLKASADFFGKLGPSLITLFKSPDALSDAAKYVGSLAGNMDAYADDLDAVGDAIGGLHYKFKQFFAGLAGANINVFKDLGEAITNLDLGPLGGKIGNVVDNLVQAFKQGKLWDTLWDGFSATIRKTGELLISVFEFAAQRFGRALEDSLRGTKIGRLAGIEDDKKVPITLSNGQVAHAVYRQYSTPKENFSDIFQRNRNTLGGDDALKRFLEPMGKAEKTSAVRDAAADAESIFKEIFDFSDSVRSAMLGNSADLLMTRNVKRVPVPGEVIRQEPLKPVLSSLARIGGAAAFTRNPLVSIQKRTNQLLETIAANTAKRQAAAIPPAWG